jgi:hypothetical protein
MTWLTHRDMENKMASFVLDAEFNYRQACQNHSDINENLPVLRKYADECDHVTEMGTRTGISTWALVSSNANTIVLYDQDIRVGGWLEPHFLCAKELNKNITFHCISTIDPRADIEETDLLFIDTYHYYDHLTKELAMHGMKARKYLVFHDTAHSKFKHELNPAIDEFMEEYKGVWVDQEIKENCNGLRVIKRVD